MFAEAFRHLLALSFARSSNLQANSPGFLVFKLILFFLFLALLMLLHFFL